MIFSCFQLLLHGQGFQARETATKKTKTTTTTTTMAKVA
jgi:hypothetical protein